MNKRIILIVVNFIFLFGMLYCTQVKSNIKKRRVLYISPDLVIQQISEKTPDNDLRQQQEKIKKIRQFRHNMGCFEENLIKGDDFYCLRYPFPGLRAEEPEEIYKAAVKTLDVLVQKNLVNRAKVLEEEYRTQLESNNYEKVKQSFITLLKYFVEAHQVILSQAAIKPERFKTDKLREYAENYQRRLLKNLEFYKRCLNVFLTREGLLDTEEKIAQIKAHYEKVKALSPLEINKLKTMLDPNSVKTAKEDQGKCKQALSELNRIVEYRISVFKEYELEIESKIREKNYEQARINYINLLNIKKSLYQTIVNNKSLDPDNFAAEELKQEAGKIADEISRRYGFFKQCLEDFSRMEADDVNYYDLNKVVLESRGFIDTIGQEKNINIKFNFCDSPSIVKISKFDMEMILHNLYRNAQEALDRKYRGESGGEIKITVIRDRDNICLYVEDNGPGVSEDLANEIFSPGVTSKEEDAEFHGIGLNWVKKTLEDYGGNISFESKTGEGTVFTIRLPLSRQSPAVNDMTAEGVIRGCV